MHTESSEKETTNDVCPLIDGVHKKWNCPKIKFMTISGRLESIKLHKLCFSCINGKHSMINCSVARQWGIDGCSKKHNRLLHSKITRGQTNQKKAQPNPSFEASSIMSFSTRINDMLMLVNFSVSSPNERYSEKTIAVSDNGSTVFYIEGKLSEKLKLRSLRQVKMSVTGIHGT